MGVTLDERSIVSTGQDSSEMFMDVTMEGEADQSIPKETCEDAPAVFQPVDEGFTPFTSSETALPYSARIHSETPIDVKVAPDGNEKRDARFNELALKLKSLELLDNAYEGNDLSDIGLLGLGSILEGIFGFAIDDWKSLDESEVSGLINAAKNRVKGEMIDIIAGLVDPVNIVNDLGKIKEFNINGKNINFTKELNRLLSIDNADEFLEGAANLAGLTRALSLATGIDDAIAHVDGLIEAAKPSKFNFNPFTISGGMEGGRDCIPISALTGGDVPEEYKKGEPLKVRDDLKKLRDRLMYSKLLLAHGDIEQASDLFLSTMDMKEFDEIPEILQFAEKIKNDTKFRLNVEIVILSGAIGEIAAAYAGASLTDLIGTGRLAVKAIKGAKFMTNAAAFTVSNRVLSAAALGEPLYDPNMSVGENAADLGWEILFNAGMFGVIGAASRSFGSVMDGLASGPISKTLIRTEGFIFEGIAFQEWGWAKASIEKRFFGSNLDPDAVFSPEAMKDGYAFLGALKLGHFAARPITIQVNERLSETMAKKFEPRIKELSTKLEGNLALIKKAYEGDKTVDAEKVLENMAELAAQKLDMLRSMASLGVIDPKEITLAETEFAAIKQGLGAVRENRHPKMPVNARDVEEKAALLLKDVKKGDRTAADEYNKLSEQFLDGSKEVLKGIAVLKGLIESSNKEYIRYRHLKQYTQLLKRLGSDASEVYKEATFLRKLLRSFSSHNAECELISCAYIALSSKFVVDSPETYVEARSLRGIIRASDGKEQREAIYMYKVLVQRSKVSLPEIYEGAKLLGSMLDKGNDYVAFSYIELLTLLGPNSSVVHDGMKIIRSFFEKKFYKIDISTVDALIRLMKGLDHGSEEMELGMEMITSLILNRSINVYTSGDVLMELLGSFGKGSREVHRIAALLRSMIEANDARSSEPAISMYSKLSTLFGPETRELRDEILAFAHSIEKLNSETREDAMDIYELMLDDVKASADVEAGLLRELMSIGVEGTRDIAGTHYSKLIQRFEKGSKDVYEEAENLRSMIGPGSDGSRAHLIKAYEDMVQKFEAGSEEVYEGAKMLREIIRAGDPANKSPAARAYAVLASNFNEGSKEVYSEAKVLRGLMTSGDPKTNSMAAMAYGFLSGRFENGSPEVYAGAEAIRRLMATGEPESIRAYASLSAKFEAGSREIYEGIKMARYLMQTIECKNAPVEIYKSLSGKLGSDPEFMHEEAMALLELIKNGNGEVVYSSMLAFRELSNGFEPDSPTVHESAMALRDIILIPKCADRPGVMWTYRRLFKNFRDGSSEVYESARFLRDLIGTNYMPKELALEAYAELARKFEPGSSEIEAGLKVMRGLIGIDNVHTKKLVYDAYAELIVLLKNGSAEIHSEAKELRNIMRESDLKTKIYAQRLYHSSIAGFMIGSKELYAEAEALRDLIMTADRDTRAMLLDSYRILSSKFDTGSAETYEGAKLLRALMKSKDDTISSAAICAYRSLSRTFEKDSIEIFSGMRTLRDLIPLRPFNEFDKNDAAQIYIELLRQLPRTPGLSKDVMKRNIHVEFDALLCLVTDPRTAEYAVEILSSGFHLFSGWGLWNDAFKGDWTLKLGLSEHDIAELEKIGSGQYVADSLSAWRGMLNYFANFSESRSRILTWLLDGGGKPRNIARAMRVISNVPGSVQEGIDRRIEQEIENPSVTTSKSSRTPKELPANIAVKIVNIELINGLKDRVSGGEKIPILMDERPEDMSLDKWDRIQKVKEKLFENKVMGLLASATAFMDDRGLNSIRRLLISLEDAVIDDGGRVVVPSRYDELSRFHRLDADLVEKWSREYRVEVYADFPMDGPEDARSFMIKDAYRKISVHAEGVSGGELPGRVRSLLDDLKEGKFDEQEAQALLEEFNNDYQGIRNNYGEVFAEIRNDLYSLTRGLDGKTEMSNKAVVEISGSVDALAKMGSEPTDTCQRLKSEWSSTSNKSGQPINKILHGQFKVANYMIGGVVAARRSVEITMDENGETYLMVNVLYGSPIYTVNVEVFDEQIFQYAESIGMDRNHVIFNYQKNSNIVTPLKTGDVQYRDTWDRENP